ncbi:biotin-dependent enzyme [Hydrogenispora ethanolica]|uniref:Biotin-dependent enzyme n=1 Tax=Hydrogenispora ethanolica TaxID=1082276 RepID=A0A4R1R872_HYDET|nr:lipoyl domain-containing protein [Hydrogenispora ethanolica]TCL61843.1 biotin-dependent enzyme [Hydrogenispora ethanolica]
MRKIEIKMPFLGPEETAYELVRWLVPAGAAVEIDQDILELMVDGALFQLPSPLDGVLLSREAEPGDWIETGQVLAIVAVE